MNISSLLVIFLIFCEAHLKKSSKQTSHLLVQDGNLIFHAANDKNIVFRTTSSAGVSINDIDLVTTLNKAQNATTLLENYQIALSSYVDRIDALEQKLSDIPLRFGNSSAQSATSLSLATLRRSYRILLRKVNKLEASLLDDNCSENPCQNGGTCQDMYKDYVCHCLQGWQGTNCMEDVNECTRFEGTDLGCQNGATCQNVRGSYLCVCKEGYFGLHCRRKVADCNMGGEELCGHGTCVQQDTNVGYKCICDQGWTTNGTNPACTVDVDECNSNHLSCSKNPSVLCINVPGSFYCGTCPTGYTGNGYYCGDINECEINNGGCSLNPKAVCINTKGSRVCGPCPSGYEGDGVTCVFKGVCQINNGGCHHLAQCRDNPRISSTYVECVCPAGYMGNGIGPNGCARPLTPKNPCVPDPCVNGLCSGNSVTGEYFCSCRRMYTGRNCDVQKDPCDPNPCLNGGTCQNSVGIRFQCACVSGFKGRLCETEKPACSERLSESAGVLKYPPNSYEMYGDHLSCSWTITTNTTKVLNITFSRFDIEKSTDCLSDWLQIHDGGNSASRLLGRFCGTDLPLGGTILTTHNIIYLWFRSNARNGKTGFELTWHAIDPACGGAVNVASHGSIESPGSPGNYPPNRDCYWSLHAPFGKRLSFHFFSLNIGSNANCDQDYIEFFTLLHIRDDFSFAKICNSSILAPFYSPNQDVMVHFHSDSKDSYPGFQITYSISEGIPGCGGIYSAQEGTIESKKSEDENKLPCEYRIQSAHNTRVKITFLSMGLLDSPGCTTDYIEIHEGPSTDSPLVERFCGTNLPRPFTSSGGITLISSVSSNSQGWKIKYEQICGMKLDNSTGSFESPPIMPYKSDCMYQIQQPLGNVIEMSIKVYNNESGAGASCDTNYVEVRDGDHEDAPLLKKFCGVGTEFITSTHNHLWIRYYRTRTYGVLTFKTTYASTEIGCGGILRSNIGYIESPPAPMDRYSYSRVKCSWVIIAPPTSVIQLHWSLLKVPRTHECYVYYVQVFDNSTELGTGGEMGRYCGNTLPSISLSTGNIVTIVFVSNTLFRSNFLLTYHFISSSKVCGGNYFTSAGIVKTPKYPDPYPYNKDCTWTITVPYGQQIMLNVVDFDLEDYSDCKFDFLEIRNGAHSTSPLIGKYCGNTILKQIPSHTNQLFLHFVSDPTKGGKGFKITWSSTATGCGGTVTSPSGSITSPHYPESYQGSTDCIWNIIVASGSYISVVFSDIDFNPEMPCSRSNSPDNIELFDGPTTHSKSLGMFCSKENKQVGSSGNQMLVKFRSVFAYQGGRGFQLVYSAICNNTVRGFKGTIESPNFFGGYRPDLNCLWNIIVPNGNKINITFSHFELESTRSCSDYIEVKYLDEDEYGEESFSNLIKYCATDNPEQLTIHSHHAQIHFVTTRVTSTFRLEWQLFGCGGYLTDSSGTIQSPNYPKAYPASTKCQWSIEVELGSSVQIQFNEVDVEKSSCQFDWIKVYNGPDNSSTLISQLCHQVNTSVLSSTGNKMFVEFHSDINQQGKGFSAQYSVVPTRCGGRFTAPQGYIFSPNYPEHFDVKDACFWIIQIDENHRIQLDFEDVQLQPDCSQYNIKVYDGLNATSPLLKTVCNDTALNDTITSTLNEMYIEFVTPYSYLLSRGFKAQYKKACGSRITTQGSGTIRINRKEFTDYYSSCTWTIISSDPTRHVTLTITQMQMVVYYCEDNEPVKVYGGETTGSPVLGTYCGSKVPKPIVSDGSALTIQLNQEMNFFATYSVLDSHCGGTFNSIKGFFATPEYPNRYPSDRECEWTINVPPGMKISVKFHVFDILKSESCNTDFLEIRSSNSSGPLKGYYCGTDGPSNITHEGTLWMMFKGSKPDDGDTVTAKGFYGEYECNEENELSGPRGSIASPLYPDKYHDLQSFSWKVTVNHGKRISFTFKEFHMEVDNGDQCYFSSLYFYDGDDDSAPLIKTVCGLNLPDPIKSSKNVVYIKFDHQMVHTGTKFLMDWLEISNVLQPSKPNPPTGCGSSTIIDVSTISRSSRYNLTSPGYPYGYGHNLKCEWIISTIPMNHLMVYIMHMDLREYGSISPMCVTDYVNFYRKGIDDNDWQLIKRVCQETDDIFYSTNLLKVQFITNLYANGTGFQAGIRQACGGSMEGPTGYIYFNTTSARHSNCQWNVTVRSGRTMTVTFEKMDIPRSHLQTCESYLMLRNGKFPDSPILGKYCGTDIPEPVNTTGNYLYVKYSGMDNIKGFTLKYQEMSVECGGEIELTPQDNYTEITSPNYPNIPLPHTECSWLIKAPPGESLRIDFEERFDLTYTYECETDYVEVRDGGTKYSSLIGRYCNKAPSTQFSTDNMMFVKFYTDTDVPRNGFKAKISIGTCGGTIRGIQGEIRNPSTPVVRDQTRNCTWHIVGPIDQYLNIQFAKLQLGSVKFVRSKITISEVRALGEVSILGEYYYARITSPIVTSSNEATVNYVGRSTTDTFLLKFNASQTGCSDALNSESGDIKSPGYPTSNHNKRYCRWTIKVPEGRRITLKFTDVDLGARQKILVQDGISPGRGRLAYLQSESPAQTLESSSNRMTVIFFSYEPSTHRGFSAHFTSDKPTICSSDFGRNSGVLTQPDVRNNSYLCLWTHNTNSAYLNQTFALSISLNVNNTLNNGGFRCKYAYWAIYVTSQDEKNVFSGLCTGSVKNHIVRSPFPVTQLHAFSTYSNEMNFTINYNTYACGGVVNEQEGHILSPNFPNKPSQPVECVWLLKADEEQTINVTVVSMDLGNDCDKSFLIVYNGDGPLHPRFGKYCKADKPDLIVSQGSSLWIEYRHDRGSAGTGFNLKYEARSEGCGGVYHDRERFIQTPNYEKSYPNNAECLWEIRSDPGYSIGLSFVGRFHIEDAVNCSKDYLEVWDWQGDQWVSIAKACGRNPPSGIRSTGDKLRIMFRSNNKTTAGGFKARWDWLCGGTLEATKTPQTLVSPGYPTAYTGNLNCVYNLTTQGRSLVINFEDFELERGRLGESASYANCKYDNVTLRAKFFQMSFNPVKFYCGTNKPPLMRMHGNTVITFKTDGYVNKRGFRLTFNDESCGGDINETTTIEGPKTNQDKVSAYFEPKIYCSWKITAPPKQIVLFRLLFLDISSFCYTDSLRVFNGLNKENRLAMLCGNVTEDLLIHADSGSMLVELESSSSQYVGFRALVYFSHGPAEGCGGSLDVNGTLDIQAPNFENLDCVWTIRAPRDYQIQIHVTDLNLEGVCDRNSTSCSSFVQIRDGGGPLSDFIEQLDGTWNTKTSRQFMTSWNTGYIRFVKGAGLRTNAFKATLTSVLSICGSSVLNVTKDIQTLTSPNYPNQYPAGIKCTWLMVSSDSKNKIELHFSNFSLADGSDKCEGDRVVIGEDPHKKLLTEGLGPQARYNPSKKTAFMKYSYSTYQHTLCGVEDSPFDFYSEGLSATLTFRSLASSQRDKGFKLEYALIGCNRNYTSLQGRFFNDALNSNCTITITVPENRTISLYFQTLRVQGYSCAYSKFEVRDGGPNGTLLLKFCHFRIPNPIFSHTNKLHIDIFILPGMRFPSSYDVGYTSTDQGRGCGGELYNYRGWVSSPLYPDEFKNDTVCNFAIRVPAGLYATIKVTTFDIVGDCDYTSLTVTTYSSDDSPTVVTLCEKDKPDIIRSYSSKIDIQYKSSRYNHGSGWMMVFQGLDDDVKDVR